MAERAARIIGLDNAGVDFITTDIRKSWLESGGKICEINPTPGVVYDKVNKFIIDYLFKNANNGHIPIILIVGSYEDTSNLLKLCVEKIAGRYDSFGYIFDKQLNICSNHSKFKTPKKNVSDLILGLLTDELVKVGIIQVNLEELKLGLDLCYANLITISGTESETANVYQSDWIYRCDKSNILCNPTNENFLLALDSLLDNFEKNRN